MLLHGGPGAPGYVAPVARRLASTFHVLEPFQQGSGDEPLTVARHVSDLHELLESRCSDLRPALVGHSWGAMLALAYAAEHPDRIACLALVSCGTFDRAARRRMIETQSERTDEELRQRIRGRVKPKAADFLGLYVHLLQQVVRLPRNENHAVRLQSLQSGGRAGR